MQIRNFWLSREVLVGVALVVLVAVPVLVFGGHEVVFVDHNNEGAEDGTSDHPYQTISHALDHAKGGTEVRIKNGTYKENITIPADVKVLSDREDVDKVIIKADNDDKPVVIMKDGTELSYVTVRNGLHGVRIKEGAEAHLYNVKVKNNKRDGIHIDSASTKKKYRVLIDHSAIRDNGRAGIYSEKRFIVLINSDVLYNGSDGLDLAAGTKGWLENNHFNGNSGSGAKMVMDGSEIWTKKNSFLGNKHEGVEINSYGGSGNIGFKKATFADNELHGVAKLARTDSGYQGFQNLFFGDGVNVDHFSNNRFGNLSASIRGF